MVTNPSTPPNSLSTAAAARLVRLEEVEHLVDLLGQGDDDGRTEEVVEGEGAEVGLVEHDPHDVFGVGGTPPGCPAEPR